MYIILISFCKLWHLKRSTGSFYQWSNSFSFVWAGNFQDREKMRIEKAIRLRYGRFFYRFPNGESAADVYDRITGILWVIQEFVEPFCWICVPAVLEINDHCCMCLSFSNFVPLWLLTGFRETLRADIDIGRFQPPDEQTPNMNLVIVSHGLTLRVFLMRWYKWTVEQFEGLTNVGNGGMLVMQTGSGGRYLVVFQENCLLHWTKVLLIILFMPFHWCFLSSYLFPLFYSAHSFGST